MALCYVASFHRNMETNMNKHAPTMAWHPETGENQIFNHPSEVPDGWLDTHPDNMKAKAPAKAEAATGALPMTREEITKALDECEISYKPKAKDKALYELLEKSLRDHFAAEKVEVPADADVPALLALVKPKSE